MFKREVSKNSPEPVSQKAIEALLRETKPDLKSPQKKRFQFIAILINDDIVDGVPPTIAAVVETLIPKNVNISGITSSLLVGLLGVPFPEGNSAEIRRELVAALLANNGAQIRIAHGECEGLFGTFGTSARLTHGEVIPRFSTVLQRLLATDFGAATEIT